MLVINTETYPPIGKPPLSLTHAYRLANKLRKLKFSAHPHSWDVVEERGYESLMCRFFFRPDQELEPGPQYVSWRRDINQLTDRLQKKGIIDTRNVEILGSDHNSHCVTFDFLQLSMFQEKNLDAILANRPVQKTFDFEME